MSRKLKPVRAWAQQYPGGSLAPRAYRTRVEAISSIERNAGYPWPKLRRWGNRIIRVTILPDSPDA